MLPALLVGAGGFLGSIARYLVSGLVLSWTGASFPYGTLVVNLLGCLGIGYLAGMLQTYGVPGPEGRLFLMIGFLGGFTTFSTFGLEALELWNDRSLGGLAGYVGGHLVLGLLAVGLGMGLARMAR